MLCKSKHGTCLLLLAAAALAFGIWYCLSNQGKDPDHDNSTLVKDMKDVCTDAKSVYKSTKKLGSDVVSETRQMKDNLMADAREVKNAFCTCMSDDSEC